MSSKDRAQARARPFAEGQAGARGHGPEWCKAQASGNALPRVQEPRLDELNEQGLVQVQGRTPVRGLERREVRALEQELEQVLEQGRGKGQGIPLSSGERERAEEDITDTKKPGDVELVPKPGCWLVRLM